MKPYRFIVMIAFLCPPAMVARAQEVPIALGHLTNILKYAGVPIFHWFPDSHYGYQKVIIQK